MKNLVSRLRCCCINWAVAIGIGTLCGPASAQELSGTLNILGYGGIFEDQYRQTVVTPFAASHPRLNIRYTTAGVSAQILGVLRTQKGSPQVDIAFLEASTSLIGNQEGLFDRITSEDVPSLRDLYPQAIVQAGYGPGFTFDHLVLIYNSRRVGNPGDSIASLWNPAFRGRVGIEAMPNLQGMLLTIMTADMIGEDWRRSIDRSVDKLAQLAPAVQTFAPKPDGYTMVANGALDWAMGWNARARYFKEHSGNVLGVVRPKESTLLIVNTMNLIKGAGNRAAALAFIEHALSPAAQAALAKAAYYTPVNRRAGVADTAAAPPDQTPVVNWQQLAELRSPWNTRWRREIISARR